MQCRTPPDLVLGIVILTFCLGIGCRQRRSITIAFPPRRHRHRRRLGTYTARQPAPYDSGAHRRQRIRGLKYKGLRMKLSPLGG